MNKIIANIPEAILPADLREIVVEAIEKNNPQYSVRLNPNKLPNIKLTDKVLWCEHAYYIAEKPKFSLDPLWHAGAYYVQEAGSMFLATVVKALNFKDPIVALDLCAAPGGKTTLLEATLPNGSVIVANEQNRARSKSLVENVIKWGSTNILVTNNNSKSFAQINNYFDFVLVDAPCSGEGLLRRNQEAFTQWSIELIDHCAFIQKNILTDALDALKPGGFLVYSTCTFNTIENENNLQWLIDEKNCLVVDLKIPEFTGVTITTTKGNKAYRFIPGLTKSEGFFITIVQKSLNENSEKFKSKKLHYKKVNSPASDFFLTQLRTNFFDIENEIILSNEKVVEVYEQLKSNLNFLFKGFHTGIIKQEKFIPDSYLPFISKHHLEIEREKIVELDYQNAIAYLSLLPFKIESENGFKIVQFKNFRLGLINVLQSRINNYYPKEWRLLHPDHKKVFLLTELLF